MIRSHRSQKGHYMASMNRVVVGSRKVQIMNPFTRLVRKFQRKQAQKGSTGEGV